MDILETLRQMKNNNSPEKFETLVNQMKYRAERQRIPGVALSDINNALSELDKKQLDEDKIPSDVLSLFLEAEEFLKKYSENDTFINESLRESEIFLTESSINTDEIDRDIKLCNFLGGNDVRI